MTTETKNQIKLAMITVLKMEIESEKMKIVNDTLVETSKFAKVLTRYQLKTTLSHITTLSHKNRHIFLHLPYLHQFNESLKIPRSDS